MEWAYKTNRITEIALHQVGIEPNTIFRILHKRVICLMFLYGAIDGYNETSSVCDRKRSGLKTVSNKCNVH